MMIDVQGLYFNDLKVQGAYIMKMVIVLPGVARRTHPAVTPEVVVSSAPMRCPELASTRSADSKQSDRNVASDS